MRAFAPSGTLRAAINFGHPILARRGPAVNDVGSADPRGYRSIPRRSWGDDGSGRRRVSRSFPK